MYKILWVSDWSGVDGGFISGMGRVSREFCGRLSRDFNLLQGGWHYEGQKHPYKYPIVRVEKGTDQKAYDSLVRTIEGSKPDILFLFGDYFYFPFTTALKARYPNLKIMGYINVDSVPIAYDFVPSLKCFDKIICSTKWGMNEIAKLDPTLKPTFVYHGVDFDTFKPLDDCTFAGIPKHHGKFCVIYNQQNTMRHNPVTAMEGFAHFAEGKNDVMMVMNTNPTDPSGSTNLYKFLNRLPNNDKIMIVKKQNAANGIPDSELNKLYNIATCGINTSTAEGVSFMILENMANKVPVIGSDYASISELLDDGRGFLIKTNNKVFGLHGAEMRLPSVRDTQKKLQMVYRMWKDTPDKLRKVGEKSYEWIKQYSWDTVYSDLYKEVIDVVNTSPSQGLYPKIDMDISLRERTLNLLRTQAGDKTTIGVMMLGGIGDNLMITPLLRGIRKRYRDAFVVVFSIGNGDVFVDNPDSDVSIELGNVGRKKTLKSFYDLFDLFYDVRGVTKVFGEEPSEYFLKNQWFYDNANFSYHDFDMFGEEHFVDMVLKSARYDNNTTIDDVNIARERYNEIPRSPFFVISNTANEERSMKELPVPVIEDVVKQLRDKGYWCVQLGRKKDKYIKGAVDFRGCTSIRQSAHVMGKSLGYVGIDGGLVHLAKSVGKKSVVAWSIFNPLNYAYKENRNLTKTKCKPCAWRVGWHEKCLYGHRYCLNLPDASEIVSGALQLAEETCKTKEIVNG